MRRSAAVGILVGALMVGGAMVGAPGALGTLGAAGVVRVDFLVKEGSGEVFLNEVNTVPGSFSFYLWEESGLPFDGLMDELIKIADARYRAKKATTFSFQNALLG